METNISIFEQINKQLKQNGQSLSLKQELIDLLGYKIDNPMLFTAQDFENYKKFYAIMNDQIELTSPGFILKNKIIGLLKEGNLEQIEKFNKYGVEIIKDGDALTVVNIEYQKVIYHKIYNTIYDIKDCNFFDESHYYGIVGKRAKTYFQIINMNSGKILDFVLRESGQFAIAKEILQSSGYGPAGLLLVQFGPPDSYEVWDLEEEKCLSNGMGTYIVYDEEKSKNIVDIDFSFKLMIEDKMKVMYK